MHIQDSYEIIHGCSIKVLQDLINKGVKVDSIVTDPPYELGFMGKAWDSTKIAYNIEFWKLCLEILKPGGYLLTFGATRTYHRMTVAIEDAGFEIRDCISWIYGQGFPKSLNISKAIDKMAGAEREIVGDGVYAFKKPNGSAGVNSVGLNNTPGYFETKPATDLAKQWDGWGSALKPAVEPIVVARAPLSEKTIVENVLKHGTGGINIDGCRVEFKSGESFAGFKNPFNHISEGEGYSIMGNKGEHRVFIYKSQGRFPANVIHDGSEEVEEEFKIQSEAMGMHSSGNSIIKAGKSTGRFGNKMTLDRDVVTYNDKGSASRFFYSAKASKHDRMSSKHPTVKPINLMKYLCRLVTPPNGLVLDPFAGSGTTGQAAIEEGFRVIMIEKEEEYINDINNRMSKLHEEGIQMKLFNGV